MDYTHALLRTLRAYHPTTRAVVFLVAHAVDEQGHEREIATDITPDGAPDRETFLAAAALNLLAEVRRRRDPVAQSFTLHVCEEGGESSLGELLN